jgi:hypothetical protein
VRPPRPCRPSKLRLLVLAERSPGASWSGFMPRHIEQPAERHSAPAARKTSCSPSSSACSLTRMEPGTTSIRTPSATRRPWMTAAAARRSSIRPLVQEPRNTVSTATSVIAVPAASPMYARADSAAVRWLASAIAAGSGTRPDSGTPCPGLVPQVTNGESAAASSRTSRSKVASGSDRSVRQWARAASQSVPCGACGRPLR